MADAPDNPHQSLAIEASLQGEAYGFVRERLRLPMGLEASFGWLRHPPTLMVVPRWADGRVLLLRRYRPGVGQRLLEFPSGRLAAASGASQSGPSKVSSTVRRSVSNAAILAVVAWKRLVSGVERHHS